MNYKTFAYQLGGRFLVLNLSRVIAYTSRYEDRLVSLLEAREEPGLEESLSGVKLDTLFSKAITTLTAAEKTLIREEFYASCNMPIVYLSRWLQDPRVVDGCAGRPFEVARAKQRIAEILRLRISARPDGAGWSTRLYKTARECVFIYRSFLKEMPIDYNIWVLLRNFGHDWARPSAAAPARSLPIAVTQQAMALLRQHQKRGKG